MKNRLGFLTLVSVLLLILAPFAMASTTWYVDGVNGNDGNHCKTRQTSCKTIGHAISLASSGDSIKVAAATYFENLTITISLKIVGSGPSKTIIDGNFGTTGKNPVVSIFTGPPPQKVTISNVTIRNGFVYDGGGGISNIGALTIIDSVITGNISSSYCTHNYCRNSYGGGIYNWAYSTLTIIGSTLTGNSSAAGCYVFYYHVCGDSAGGGIYNAVQGTVAIYNSTITNNSAAVERFSNRSVGGGIDSYGTLTISNSTIEGNAAGAGGSIYNELDGTLTISNSTVTDNSNGIESLGIAVVQNSIFANNSSENCNGLIGSNGYNLSSDDTCNFNSAGDLNNTDPMLGPLQNNGGPTQTQALLTGSPAIDAGNPNGCTDSNGHLLKTDQRGMPRPDKEDTGGCDMGAYERQSD